jgi:hypothetical protein
VSGTQTDGPMETRAALVPPGFLGYAARILGYAACPPSLFSAPNDHCVAPAGSSDERVRSAHRVTGTAATAGTRKIKASANQPG